MYREVGKVREVRSMDAFEVAIYVKLYDEIDSQFSITLNKR